MKNLIYFLFVNGLLFLSSSVFAQERVKVTPVLVYEDLESRMPGKLRIYDTYLLWTDPWAVGGKGYLHIIDLKTQQEIGQFIDLGQGPKEFNAPVLSENSGNKLFIYDLNLKRSAFLYLDSLQGTSSPIQYVNDEYRKSVLRMVEIEEGQMVLLKPEQIPFLHFNDQQFGDTPFKEKATNWYDIMQGHLLYNSQRNYLVYANIGFPYMVLYKKENDEFKKMWERKDKFAYELKDKQIRVDSKRRGVSELALTKDYIVTNQRDYDKDPTDESTVKLDFSKISRNLFLYDYDSNLIKILDLGAPVLRIAGNEKTNTVYAIVVDPDFHIVKVDLDNL